MVVCILLCSMTVGAEGIPQYRITVNIATNYVAVFTHSAEGEYNIPVIGFTCSTGKNNATPTGTYTISDHIEFHTMLGTSVFAQYAVRITGHIMFHGVPDVALSKDAMKVSYFNQLGEQASAGCIRLTAADAKWIYDNCPAGTVVEIIDDLNDYGPFGKPMVPTISDGHPYTTWDPTDPDPKNTWINERPVVKLVANSTDGTTLSLPAGTSYETMYNSIGLFTPQGEVYAGNYALDIYGVYDLNAPGNYTLYVRGHDLTTTLRGDATIKLVVN